MQPRYTEANGHVFTFDFIFGTATAKMLARKHFLATLPKGWSAEAITSKYSTATTLRSESSSKTRGSYRTSGSAPSFNSRGQERQTQKWVPKTRYALVNRPDVTSGHERPSQRPFGVSTQIQKLFTENKLEEAIKMVEDAPLSSQNVVIWALLIKQALQEKRFNRAFELWQSVSIISPPIKGY